MTLAVVHVAPISNDWASGLMYSVPSLIRSLHSIGVQTALLSSHLQDPYAEPQPFPIVHYRNNGYFPSLDVLTPPFNHPDLLVFHSIYDSPYVPLHAILAAQARRKGIPYILTPRGELTHGAQAMKKRKKQLANALYGYRMIRQAAAIHCLTENEASDARGWNHHVFVVGNGIDMPEISSAPPSDTSKRELQFVFIGRLDINHKGLDLLVDACRIAQDTMRDTNAQVHIYGPDANNSKDTLQQTITAYQIGDFVHLHEPIFGSEKELVLRTADLFLHTSRFEGHPMSVLEALSYGVPCLLTPGTNIATVVSEAQAGWEVKPDAVDIANGMCTVLGSPSSLREYRSNARRLAQSNFSWEHVARQVLVEYLKYAKPERA